MRNLTLAICVALGGLGLIGCGGVDAVGQCKDLVSTTCSRVYECYDAATKASAPFVAQYGASQSECNSKLQSTSCANISNDKPCTDSSKKYSADKASACVGDLKAASCATITGGTFNSDNCNNVCM